MSLTNKPTIADVRARQESDEIGMDEARRVLIDEWREENLINLQSRASKLHTVEDLREIVADLLQLLVEDCRR